MSSTGGFGVAGQGALVETTEAEILWGGDAAKGMAIWKSALIDGATRDASSTPTTLLQPGLVLAQLDADSKFTDYDPNAEDGSEVAVAILGTQMRAQDFDAADADRVFRVLVGGPVKAGQLNGLDDQARVQLGPRFIFDDDLIGSHNFLGLPWKHEQIITDTTLVAADAGKRIVCTTADCDVTLPALATNAGFAVEVLMAANFELIITSAEGGNIIAGGEVAADTFTLTVTGEQLGQRVRVEAIFVGTTPHWLLTFFESPGANAGTVLGTVAFAVGT
jgi:hypothetical protein